MTNGLAKFKSTPWNNQGATDPATEPSPNVPGHQAVRFHMPSGGKRTEAEPDVDTFKAGETKFVGYSGMFGDGFPIDPSSWQLIMQFKQPGEGSPPLAVQVEGGQLRLDNNGTNPKEFCPVQAGKAFSFRLGITFGGTIDAWCNGQQTLTKYKTPSSNVAGSAYLKTGIYRDSSINQDSTLYVNDIKVGDTLASVSGLTGAPETGTDAAGTGAGTAGSTAAGTTGGRSDNTGAGTVAGAAAGAGLVVGVPLALLTRRRRRRSVWGSPTTTAVASPARVRPASWPCPNGRSRVVGQRDACRTREVHS